MFQIAAKLGQIRHIKEDDKEDQLECRSACHTHLYSMLVTAASYPTKTTFEYTKGPFINHMDNIIKESRKMVKFQ